MQKMIPSLLEKYLPLSPKSHVGSLKRLASRLLSKKSPPPYLSGSWKHSQCLESLLLCDRYQTGCAFFQPTSCWKLTQGNSHREKTRMNFWTSPTWVEGLEDAVKNTDHYSAHSGLTHPKLVNGNLVLQNSSG